MGIVPDSTARIDAERAGQTPRTMIANLLAKHGDVDAVLSAITVAELAHGIERAHSIDLHLARRRFLAELIQEMKVQPVTTAIAFRAGTINGSLQAKRIQVALADLLIGSTALELGYSVLTSNLRHFKKIPGLVVMGP